MTSVRVRILSMRSLNLNLCLTSISSRNSIAAIFLGDDGAEKKILRCVYSQVLPGQGGGRVHSAQQGHKGAWLVLEVQQ